MTNTLSIAARTPRRPLGFCAGWALALIGVAGCATPWERSLLLNDKRAEIGSVQGPVERKLRGEMREKKNKEAESGDALLKPIDGTDEYLAAQELYEQKQYEEAQKAFKKVAKAFKKSEIREDALFMQAESYYAMERYAKAHDRYAVLIKEYPTTRHLDVISTRLFKIAMIWLEHPQVAELTEIQQVDYDHYGDKLPPKEPNELPKRNVLVPNFTDDTRPLFDPQGNAVAALKAIWTNDPTGPLADDALMLAASYYARTGDFLEADRHFTLLREQFPNSPHVQKAFELGAHVKLMSYQGSSYDGKSLRDSEQLKLATLRLYPELKDKERMKAELAKIEQAKADRLWAMVVYYDGKRLKKAAAIYCHLLIAEHPKSAHVQEAYARLEQYGPAYANGKALQNPYPDPPRTLWAAIFPPPDNGGVPAAPPMSPSEKFAQPPQSYGGKFALIKPTTEKPQSASESPENIAAQPRRYGSKFALIKPRAEDQQVKSKEKDQEQTKPASESVPADEMPSRRPALPRGSPPKPLPNDIDADAKPAPAGKARLKEMPGQKSASDSDSEDDDQAGHTRL